MNKGIKIILVLACIVILMTACNNPRSDKMNKAVNSNQFIEFDNEESIKEYLIGEWLSDKEVLSDYLLTQSNINCNMYIDEQLNVALEFYNRETNESKNNYEGKISLDRRYADLNQVPDLISIELTDNSYPGGDFFFKHRTAYDGKHVMSLFFAGNGNCIFDMLADVDRLEYAPEEIIFEKTTKEKSQGSPRKDSGFYAVFWGKGSDRKSLWINEVQWTPTDEYDPQAIYPTRMTLYHNELAESVLYPIATEKMAFILENDIYPGEVYFVQTNKKGQIIDFEDAAHKAYIETINNYEN